MRQSSRKTKYRTEKGRQYPSLTEVFLHQVEVFSSLTLRKGEPVDLRDIFIDISERENAEEECTRMQEQYNVLIVAILRINEI